MKTYRATSRSLCECCDEGVRRGMPIHYVKPFAHWRNGWKSSVAIHTRCARMYELEVEGKALYARRNG